MTRTAILTVALAALLQSPAYGWPPEGGVASCSMSPMVDPAGRCTPQEQARIEKPPVPICPVGEKAYASDQGKMVCRKLGASWIDGDSVCTPADHLMQGAAQCTPLPPARPSWHLLTKSYGGTVSLNHGLTKEQCERQQAKLLKQPYTEEEKRLIEERTQKEVARLEAEYDAGRQWWAEHPECRLRIPWGGPPPGLKGELDVHKNGECWIWQGILGSPNYASTALEAGRAYVNDDDRKRARVTVLHELGFRPNAAASNPGDIVSAECFE